MSNPLWLAVNCRRSGKKKSPDHWTAHWKKCGLKFDDLPKTEEGGFLVFPSKRCEALNAEETYQAFKSRILAQIRRLARGKDWRDYTGANAKVPIAYDCDKCKVAVPVAIKTLIDRYNEEHGGVLRG